VLRRRGDSFATFSWCSLVRRAAKSNSECVERARSAPRAGLLMGDNPVQRLILAVSAASKDADDDLDEADRPAGAASDAPGKRRKRRSRNRSFKMTRSILPRTAVGSINKAARPL
jgi:hypothetical protein